MSSTFASILARPNNRNQTNRTQHQANCSQCGMSTTLPFRPTQGKPVYCQTCFRARQQNTPDRGNVNGKVRPDHTMTSRSNVNGAVRPNHNITSRPNANGAVRPDHNMQSRPNANGAVRPNHNMQSRPNANGAVRPNTSQRPGPRPARPEPARVPEPVADDAASHVFPGIPLMPATQGGHRPR